VSVPVFGTLGFRRAQTGRCGWIIDWPFPNQGGLLPSTGSGEDHLQYPRYESTCECSKDSLNQIGLQYLESGALETVGVRRARSFIGGHTLHFSTGGPGRSYESLPLLAAYQLHQHLLA
jgi:hypothetical protein